MEMMTCTDARRRFKSVMDRVINGDEEVVVTRKGRESVVVISLGAWNSIRETKDHETMHLLSTPSNASRLRASIAQLDAGAGEERQLVE